MNKFGLIYVVPPIVDIFNSCIQGVVSKKYIYSGEQSKKRG